MNSLEIEKVLRAFGFEEKPNSIKSKKFTHDELEHPVYVKRPSGNTKVDYVSKQPLVVHDSYEKLLKELHEQFKGVLPNFGSFYHATSLTEFNKRKHKGEFMIHYGIAVDFDSAESLIYFITGMTGIETLNISPSTSDEFVDDLNTVRNTWTEVRVGKGVFRRKLLDMWKGCSVTGVLMEEFLIASHIKPWAKSKGSERLDVYNGLLLTPTLDKAFDKGYISFNDEGNILISRSFLSIAKSLGIDPSMSISLGISNENKEYLKWHRCNLYKNA